MMWCAKCNKHLSECTCPDMDERLASLNGSKHFVYRKCLICGKHYDRCKCENPKWGLSNDKVKEENENTKGLKDRKTKLEELIKQIYIQLPISDEDAAKLVILIDGGVDIIKIYEESLKRK